MQNIIRPYFSLPPRCIFFKFLEDTLLGLIQDTMPPQAAILGEFEDHYTQILWPTLNVFQQVPKGVLPEGINREAPNRDQ